MSEFHSIEVDYTPKQKVTTFWICDGCGLETKNTRKWPEGKGNLNSTCIEMEQGTIDPDGGSFVESTSFHLCPTCFKEKLIPLLTERFGKGPRIKETTT